MGAWLLAVVHASFEQAPQGSLNSVQPILQGSDVQHREWLQSDGRTLCSAVRHGCKASEGLCKGCAPLVGHEVHTLQRLIALALLLHRTLP